MRTMNARPKARRPTVATSGMSLAVRGSVDVSAEVEPVASVEPLVADVVPWLLPVPVAVVLDELVVTVVWSVAVLVGLVVWSIVPFTVVPVALSELVAAVGEGGVAVLLMVVLVVVPVCTVGWEVELCGAVLGSCASRTLVVTRAMRMVRNERFIGCLLSVCDSRWRFSR
jgi:hypothetical protein